MRNFALIAVFLLAMPVLGGCEKAEDGSEKGDQTEQQASAEQQEAAEEEKAEPQEPKKTSNGFVQVSAEKSFDEVVSGLEAGIEKAKRITLVTKVDHAKGAQDVGMELPATTLLVFGNPSIGTPLMKGSQTAGLDLPLKILVWETEGGEVKVGFNAPDYIAARHGIDKYGLFRSQMEGAIEKLIAEASGASVEDIPQKEVMKVEPGDGMVSVESKNGVDATFNRLEELLEEADGVEIFATVDHTANAEKANRELGLTKLIIFGNPKLGTPLMQKARTIGVDLPMKFLVWESPDAEINVTYNDPKWLTERHGLEVDEKKLEKMTRTLEKLAAKATKELN